MIGHIHISGLIGSYTDEKGVLHKGVELIDVISQVQKQKDSEEFVLHINSEGGGVETGYDIYNYLKSLPQKITTVIEGMCASMATVVALAGDVRIMTTESKFMIHNPWIGGVKGDADELLSAAEEIRAEEDRMIDFYSEHTGVLKEGFDALMKSETYLTPDQAKELGFIHEIRPTVKALAFKKTDTMSKEILSKIDQVLALVGIKKEEPKKLALMVADSNGVQVEIKKADGSEITGQPTAGDMCTVEGKPAEGTYIFPDMGVSIDAKAGVISAVNPIEQEAKVDPANDPNSPEYIKTELAKSQARVAELETQIKEHDTFKAEVETKFALIEKGLKSTSSNYQVQGRSTDFREDKKDTPVNITKESMKKRRSEYKTQNEK